LRGAAFLARHHADCDMTKRHGLVDVRVEGQDAATEDENHSAQERNGRAEEPGDGDGGAPHESVVLQFAIRNGVGGRSVPGNENGRERTPAAVPESRCYW
jgi:hypothetical protein